MRAFKRCLGEENSIIGDDADGIAVNSSEARDEGLAVHLLEFVEARAIDYTGYHLAHVVRPFQVRPDDAVELVDGVHR